MKLITTLALATVAIPGLALAATSQGEGHATAKVIDPIQVQEESSLNFGTMTNDETGEDVVVDYYSGTASGANVVNDSSNPPQTGVLYVNGPANQPISVSIPTNASISSDSGSMNVTLNPDVNGETALDGTGQLVIRVGGSVSPAGVGAGDYQGAYTITVDY